MLRRNISSVFVNSFLVNVPIPDLPFCHISGVFMGCDWGTLNSVYCRISLREKCPYSEFFWSLFSTFGLNTDQKNFEYGHFSRSALPTVK